ncbi:MAG: hemerythrin domain-containing protein [Deltaproteobacteria bacterium]|nr:MAG: hemerythrin domain-containing protein [Deltaproteobacteria bacterium]
MGRWEAQHSNTPVSRRFRLMRHPSLTPLSHDHHHGLALALRCRKQALGQIKPMGAAGLRERAKEFLSFYASNLVAHFRAEEEVLFPLLGNAAPGSSRVIDELLSEHEQIRQAATQLENGTGLAKLIFDLGDLLERHIRKEERELFPLFEQHVKAAEAVAIGQELKKVLNAGPV